MQSNIITTYKQRWSIHPRNLVPDLIAGLTTAVSSIPDSMASALLAGINPLTGLYTMIIATPIGALFTSSEVDAYIHHQRLISCCGKLPDRNDP